MSPILFRTQEGIQDVHEKILPFGTHKSWFFPFFFIFFSFVIVHSADVGYMLGDYCTHEGKKPLGIPKQNIKSTAED